MQLAAEVTTAAAAKAVMRLFGVNEWQLGVRVLLNGVVMDATAFQFEWMEESKP